MIKVFILENCMKEFSSSNEPEILNSTLVEYGGLKFQWVLTPQGRKAVRAAEVIKALGKEEKHTSRLVNQYVFPDYRFTSSFGNAGRPAIYLYEHGAVQLATRIDSPEAEPFQRWIFETVVKLFAEGGIILSTATQQQLETFKQKIAELEQQNLEAFEQGKLIGASEGYLQQANQLGTLLRKFITSGRLKPSVSGSVPMPSFNMEFVRWCNQSQNTEFKIPVDGEQGRAIYVALSGLLPEFDKRREFHCGEFWLGNSKLKLQLEVAEPNWQGVAKLYGAKMA